MSSSVHWVTGSPLWASATATVAAGDSDGMRRPALLRFASDSFMDDLAAILRDRPAELAERVAKPVSFRNRPPGAPEHGWPPPLDVLKLYQPLHGDFNLVVASLVCGHTGLPDHTVRPADGERAGFVFRRLDTAGGELAWATEPADPAARSWLPVPAGQESTVVDGEELFPLFPVVYPDQDRKRRLFAGLVPVSSRETFRAAGRLEPFPPRGLPGGTADADPRRTEFDSAVLGPLTDLRRPDPVHTIPGPLRLEGSAFLLLDFADLLRRHLPLLWQALSSATRPASAALGQLYDDLASTVDPVAGLTWRAALLDAAAQWAAITGEPGSGAPRLRCDVSNSTLVVPATSDNDPLAVRLREHLYAALSSGAAPPAGTPGDLPVPKIESTGEARYVIRCVYRRPRCAPRPVDIVSRPTSPFAIAQVFDPDAPARTIRIPLPVDTGVKDLRKFRKGVGFLLSNQLRGQLDRITDLKKAMNGKVANEESWDLGVICQFSIPVITICALMVLIVFVFLLNIVFFWSSFFRLCLPVPLRSKSRSKP